ncbi:MAG: PQQ-binding-like beta-propeller repeat protein, partial [Gemmatimonadota bacterium]
FVASSTTTLYALYAESGSLAWTFDPDYKVSGSWAMPTVAGSRVFFFTNAGSVYAFEPAAPGFQYIGTWDSGSRRD